MTYRQVRFSPLIAVILAILLGVSAATAQTCLDAPTGLIGWWPGDSSAIDIVGAHDGTLMSGASIGTGYVDNGFVLDGVDDHVGSIGTTTSFAFVQNTGVFTVDAWIKVDDPFAPDTKAIVASNAGTIQKGFFFALLATRELRLFIGRGVDGSPTISSLSSPDVITDSDWHHVAAVGDGSGVTFYVDGQPIVGSGTMGAMSSGDSSFQLAIGRCPGGVSSNCPFNGSIDEVEIFDRALGASEVLAIYDAGTQGKCKSHSDPEATVWGIKSEDRTNNPSPRTRLFTFPQNGTGQVLNRGAITIEGQNVCADALAISETDGLLCFRLDEEGSQLIAVDSLTGAATVIGPLLAERDVRGAAFDEFGVLWVVDAASNEVLIIDPDLGSVVGAPTTLTLGGEPVDVDPSCDLAVNGSGTAFLISSLSTTVIYEIDLATGELMLRFEDTVVDADDDEFGCASGAFQPRIAGGAFTVSGGPDRLLCYDVNCEDDLYMYDTGQAFARQQLQQDILPAFNAGRGDLAALIPVVTVAVSETVTPDGVGPRPTVSRLRTLAPSPFRSSLAIGFDLATYGHTTVRSYSVGGVLVRELLAETRSAGAHTVRWDGRGEANRSVPAGVYYVRMEAPGVQDTKRVVLVR